MGSNKPMPYYFKKAGGNMTESGAERLAIAIIKSACDDYKTGKDSEEKFIRFCKSERFALLTNCSSEYLIEKMRIERREYLHEQAQKREGRQYKKKCL